MPDFKAGYPIRPDTGYTANVKLIQILLAFPKIGHEKFVLSKTYRYFVN
jgi:hypothetical protein